MQTRNHVFLRLARERKAFDIIVPFLPLSSSKANTGTQTHTTNIGPDKRRNAESAWAGGKGPAGAARKEVQGKGTGRTPKRALVSFSRGRLGPLASFVQSGLFGSRQPLTPSGALGGLSSARGLR